MSTSPDCLCGHSEDRHMKNGTMCLDLACPCTVYRPKVSITEFYPQPEFFAQPAATDAKPAAPPVKKRKRVDDMHGCYVCGHPMHRASGCPHLPEKKA